MNFALFATICMFACIGYSAGSQFSYEGYRLIRLELEQKHADLLQNWEDQPGFDLWAHSRRGSNYSATVFLSPIEYLKYKQQFIVNGIDYEIVSDNYQRVLDESDAITKADSRIPRANIVNTFARYSAIIDYLKEVSADYSYVSQYVAGKTFENRDIYVLKIATPSAKKAIWIDCGIHAREWISPATCIYMIDAFINGYEKNNANIVSILNYYELHIMPVQNPDGYEFSHTNTRLWRKNRNYDTATKCYGVDLNRNYGHQWYTGGSSNNPCSDTYAGPKANSELETQAVQKAINAKLGQWDAFFTIHTYGLWWFTTWGYTTALPNDYNQLIKQSESAVAAFNAANGLKLTHGSSANILYIASGGSEDWSTAVAGIKYSYCLELRPGQSGTDSSYGFQLPQDRIPKAGSETFAGIVEFLRNLKP